MVILDLKWKNLAELCSSVLLKVEHVMKLYLTEEISKKNVEGTAWFLLTL